MTGSPQRLFGFHAPAAFLLTGVVVHLLFLLSLRFGFLDPLFDDAMHRKGRGADLYAVVQAGQNLTDGISIYSTSPVQQVVPYYYPYRYHPFVAWTVGRFFVLFTPGAAYGLWIIFLEVLLLINLGLTRALLGDNRRSAVGMSLWLLFSPLYLEYYLGQFSFVMASLIFWSLLAWNDEQKRFAGDAAWVLSLIVKSNSVVLAPVLMKQRRWNLLAVAGGAAVLTAIPYFLLVPGTLQEFARNFTEPMSMKTLFGNQGFAALVGIVILRNSGLWTDDLHVLHARLDPMDQLMELPLLAWTVFVVAVTAAVTIRAARNQIPALFLLWILAYFLFYKHVWEHQYVMMLPVFVLLYYYRTQGRVAVPGAVFWGTFGVIALPTILVFIDLAPVLVDPEIYWEPWKSYLFHLPKPLATLTLYGVLTACILRDHPFHQPSHSS